jgi:aspartate racemase
LILGCTELPLILEENDAFKFDKKSVVVLNPTNILSKKCVNVILDLDHYNSKIVRKRMF